MIEAKIVDEELTISPPHKKHEEPRSNTRGSLRYNSVGLLFYEKKGVVESPQIE